MKLIRHGNERRIASLKKCTEWQFRATAHYLRATHLHEDNYAGALRKRRGVGGGLFRLSSFRGNHLDSIRLCFHFSNANAVTVALTFNIPVVSTRWRSSRADFPSSVSIESWCVFFYRCWGVIPSCLISPLPSEYSDSDRIPGSTHVPETNPESRRVVSGCVVALRSRDVDQKMC